MKQPVIAIFDIGKTNKKLFLFNQQYEIVWEKSAQFDETTDEDGDPCEDVEKLSNWIKSAWQEVQNLPDFEPKAVNFSGYGASFVSINSEGKSATPLYNYLKPYPESLHKQFYGNYGGEEVFATQTASPILGSLNSAMILYRLKYEKPAVFEQIKYSLHLPQYLSFLLSEKCASDITSVGCHTNLWNFTTQTYHEWVDKEGIGVKLAPIQSQEPHRVGEHLIGIGLHDSSAALIPYLASFQEPFVLISTGTWCISMNPFNAIPLTFEELQYDCLCFLTYQGKPVKSSRLFAGYEHEQEIKLLAERFGVANDYYKTVAFNSDLIENGNGRTHDGRTHGFAPTYESEYHQLMLSLVNKQVISTALVLRDAPVSRIFVDGGFGKNPIYMNLLAKAFPEKEVFAASVAQASALGAALAIHEYWNKEKMPATLIDLKKYL